MIRQKVKKTAATEQNKKKKKKKMDQIRSMKLHGQKGKDTRKKKKKKKKNGPIKKYETARSVWKRHRQ